MALHSTRPTHNPLVFSSAQKHNDDNDPDSCICQHACWVCVAWSFKALCAFAASRHCLGLLYVLMALPCSDGSQRLQVKQQRDGAFAVSQRSLGLFYTLSALPCCDGSELLQVKQQWNVAACNPKIAMAINIRTIPHASMTPEPQGYNGGSNH